MGCVHISPCTYMWFGQVIYHSEPVSSTLKWGWDVNVLCKPRNSTKDKFLLFHLSVHTEPVAGVEGWWRASLTAPLGVTWCTPQSSVSCLLEMGMGQEGQDDFSALCPPTLIPRGHCLLGQWATETGVCYEWLWLHLPREQELDPPLPLELWAGESQPSLWTIQRRGK